MELKVFENLMLLSSPAARMRERQRLQELKDKTELEKLQCLQRSRQCTVQTALMVQRTSLQLSRRHSIQRLSAARAERHRA